MIAHIELHDEQILKHVTIENCDLEPMVKGVMGILDCAIIGLCVTVPLCTYGELINYNPS